MSNPMETGTLKRALKFVSLGHPELYWISEPPGSDASNYIVDQDENRFGRDVVYGNDKNNLMFYDAKVEKTEIEQLQGPEGQVSYFLDHGMKWIFETVKRFGYEGVIEFILYKDGVFFTLGRLDIANPDTNGFTYFGCKIVQNLDIELYKKNFDTSINLFATRDLRNNPITPAPTLKVLRKATPITRSSKWVQKTEKVSRTGYQNSFNFFQQIEVSDIENTLTPYYAVPSGTYAQRLTNCRYISAINTLTKGKLKININAIFKYRWASGYGTGNTAVLTLRGAVSEQPFTGNENDTFTIYTKTLSGNSDIDFTLPTEILYDLPTIPRGQSLYIMWDWVFSDGNLHGGTRLEIANGQMEIVATQTAIAAVINTIRYIDVLKQLSKFINNLPINAPMFDVGGSDYNNVCWGRGMISPSTSNSIVLQSSYSPEGTDVGQVVNNTDDLILPKGLYFWNGTLWVYLDVNTIPKITLTTNALPAGSTIGDLAFNESLTVEPIGLCYWNGVSWQSLEYTKPFETSIKDAFSASMTLEVCGDYEFNKDKIDFTDFEGFYPNNEIGVFMIPPGTEFKQDFNPRFKLNNMKVGYNVFEQNRLSKNTSEDIHTLNERSIGNLGVENKFELAIKYIRSIFSQQAMMDLDTKTPLTADENDDKVNISAIVPLPANSFAIEYATLLMRLSGTNLEILNKALVQNENDVAINWLTIGVQLGDTFEIITGQNVGNYIIVGITQTILTLDPVTVTPTFEGDAALSFKYYYTDVEWVTETNERVTVLSGLNNGDEYQNLFYSIRRTIARWEKYLKSATLWSTIPILRNLKFKNNPKLRTQVGSGQIYGETEDILTGNMPDPILTGWVFMGKVKADFEEALAYLEAYRNGRGWVRCLHPDGRVIKGYVQHFEQIWRTNELNLILEEKYESQNITVTYNPTTDVIEINDVPYNLNGNLNWYVCTIDDFVFFDEKSRALNTRRRFDEITFNSVVYNSASELIDAILLLLP